MMKKNGFTLAEVLITLAIIGVVASLTLPALMTNTGEQQSMTGYRKILNSLNEAGQLSAALNGFDYSTMTGFGAITDSFSNGGAQTLGAIINEHLKVSPAADNVTLGTATSCAVITDGTAVCLGGNYADNQDWQIITVDTNGTKGPNRLSECDAAGCTNRAGRHIYDQFQVTLNGGNAFPGAWTGFRTYANSNNDNAALFAAGMANQAGGAAGGGAAAGGGGAAGGGD